MFAEGEGGTERKFYIKYQQYSTFEGHLTNPGQNSTLTIHIGYTGDYVEGGFSVGWNATNGTASAGSDFTPASGTVNFTDTAEGEQAVNLTIINDTLDELDETFTVQVGSPDGARGSTEVTIFENDLHVAIFDADPVTEGDVSWPINTLPVARFRATISSPRTSLTSIPLLLIDGSPEDPPAFEGVDFHEWTSVLEFAPGQTERFIEVPIIGDRLHELTERFHVHIWELGLLNPAFIVDDPYAMGTIVDNDPLPTLAVDDVTVEETDGTATLTVTMTNRSSFPVTFDWTLADQSATRSEDPENPEDYDYHAVSGTVTIPAGGGPDPHLESFNFQINDDFLTEPDETFLLTISNAVNANITKATGVVTILANDPRVDIDVDSNNNGTITGTDDPIEMDAPGNVVMINRDDDNGNGIADYLDLAGPLANPDDDLEPVNLAFIQDGLPQDELNQLVVRLTYTANVIRVWDTRTKDHQIVSDRWWTIAQFNQLPATLFMEGIGSGQGILTLTLHRLEGDLSTIVLPDFGATLVHFDHVVVTVTTLDLTGYTPYTEPFQLRPIAEANEESPGVHIRRNGDDDNGNGSPDRLDAHVENENDLIQVSLATGMSGLPGIRVEFERGSHDIRVWSSRNKGTPLFAANNNVGPIVLDWWAYESSVWVEWVTPGTGTATSSLDLRLIDTTNNVVIASDRLVFHPFTSVVIVLGGENQDPADPVLEPNNHGIFRSAIDLYSLNYDVHMYNEDEIGWETSPPLIDIPLNRGIPYREVVDAIQNRGVTNVAIYGYSHGGGSTYDLANLLNLNVLGYHTDITQPFTLAFTSYIDAITDNTTGAENRRPPLSQFHLNQYQRNFIIDWPPGDQFIGGPSNGNEDLNRNDLTSLANQPIRHTTIDDHPVVLGLLRDRFRERVSTR
jgi:hypothetical protein